MFWYSCGLNKGTLSAPRVLAAVLQELTFDSRAADQVRVGEVERSLQHEVGLQHLPHLLTEVGIETGALQRNLPLLAELQRSTRPS